MESDSKANYWPQIVLLIAAAANFMQFREPLRSSRPAPAVVSERRVMGEADVEARLWQDPFEAVAATEARASSKKPPVALNESVDPRYSLDGLVRQMQRFAESDTAENQVTVLAVMVPGDTYTEAVETRLKARYAVLAGLVESGIAPENSELIGRCYLPWNRSGSIHPELNPDQPIPRLSDRLQEGMDVLQVPYEWLSGRIPLAGATNRLNSQSVLVLWLREEAFADYPLLRLAQLLGSLRERFYTLDYFWNKTPKDYQLRLRVLGPALSSTLIRMVEPRLDNPKRRFEGASTGRLSEVQVAGKSIEEVLRGPCSGHDVEFTSASATAADEVLKIPPTWGNRASLREFPVERFRKMGLRFESTCATDRQLVELLIDELKERDTLWSRNPNWLAVLTEYDTYYGRVMAETVTNVVATKCGAASQPVILHYLRGVDGGLPRESEKPGSKNEKTDRGDKAGTSGVDRQTLEIPEGRSQLDYIPRLVARLRAMPGASGIRAVGILGSDVYDKLLLLQSLRHEFPDVVFFTTDLDARLFHHRELSWSRNLLVASSYGLQLADSFQGKIPPFRDWVQTSTFLACMRLIGHANLVVTSTREDVERAKALRIPLQLAELPRLFEIGREGPVDLSVSHLNVHPSRDGVIGWVSLPVGRILVWMLITILLVGVLALISPRLRAFLEMLRILLGSAVVPSLRHQLPPPFVQERAFAYSCVAWMLILVLAGFGVWVASNHFSERGEIFSITNGISIWPAEALRLLGFYASLGCLVYSWWRLRTSEAKLASDYALPRPIKTQCFSWWQALACLWPWSPGRIGVSISRWKDRDGDVVDAQEVWNAYQRLGTLQSRLNRVLPLSLLYFAFGLLLVIALGFPMVPFRGGFWVWLTDKLCLFPFIIAFIVVMFTVLDDTRLATRLIQLLAAKPTNWRRAQAAAARETKIPVRLLDDYLDVRFIADRTAALAPLIYCPFGLLALMVLSRNPVFDRWGWPVSLLILFGLNSVLTLFSAISLKRTAERARKQALGNLQNQLLRILGSTAPHREAELAQLKELMAEIRAIRKGAFAPLPTHPAIGAALLPFGGAGVVALLDLLAGS